MNILKLANEYENKLKNSIQKELKDNKLKILLDNGIVPLLGEDSFIGSGKYSDAYRVLYKGIPCVAKISSYNGEFDNILKLFSLKDKLGEQEKHILKVYDYFENNKHNIIIVEELYPINSHISSLLYSNFEKESPNYDSGNTEQNTNQEIQDLIKTIKYKKNRFNNLMQDDEFIDKLITKKLLINSFKIFLLNNNLYHKVYNLIFSKLKENNILNNVSKAVALISFDIKVICRNFKSRELFIKIMQEFESNLIDVLNLMAGPEKILKKDFDELTESNFADLLPEAESLMKCLLKLKDMGIAWSDLHYRNIMERKDKTLVISDPGLFKEI